MGYSRVVWGMSALLWLIITVLWCVWFGWPATLVAVIFAILPDIALVGAFASQGKLKPERVAFYNTMHNALIAVGVLVAGFAVFMLTGGMDGGIWAIGLAGLAWFVHIAADRAFGFGRRDVDGSIIPVA
ncbi:DUF4260 domain-containing protein [Leucobacter aridicollis]|uniref:DUF4260 domain-containing protein n=1 Tax=Leucobacter aridicollis TaxID=283878 RepID=UPI0021693D54|nr:DUF4260 domain-containing protein [Leucobacter aridicollis]MCS3428168.1 hypothetical protein [Leucobacter aridicollis]